MNGTFGKIISNSLFHPRLIKKANTLNNQGIVKQDNGYCFLKISDDFVHGLYPELNQFGEFEKPDYFNTPQEIGAHITIIYPEENTSIKACDLGQIHTFHAKDLLKARLDSKEYIVVLIESPSIIEIRAKYQLAPQPTYKRNGIDLHITIGVRSVPEVERPTLVGISQ